MMSIGWETCRIVARGKFQRKRVKVTHRPALNLKKSGNSPIITTLPMGQIGSFSLPWLGFWRQVHEGQGSCGTALKTGKRIIVEDVAESPLFKGTPGLDVELAAGVRAIQSTPLIGRSGKVLGILSTHFSVPHRPDGQNLQRLDLLVRQATDIIERAEAEDDLRLMAIIVQDSNDAITVQDLKGSILKWNRGARRMCGWNEVEAVGMNIIETIPKDKEAECTSFIYRLIAGEEIKSFQTRRRTKDDRVLDVWLTVTKIMDRQGNITAIATTERDTTELGRSRKRKP